MTCVDINECDFENFGCFYKCVNTPGGAYCACPAGFKLDNDGKNCNDIDECSDGLDRCEQICHNTLGNYSCSCNPGYIPLKEFKCQGCRINSYRSENDSSCLECPQNSFTKGETQTSISDCHCGSGFSGNPALDVPCVDNDECAFENFGCSHMCINTPGSAVCSCPPGFELKDDQKTCQDTDECRVKNGGCEGLCNNTEGSFSCICTKGYITSETDKYSCSDVDECQVENGGCSDLCVNFPGSYHCSCPHGYRLDAEGKSCIAIRCLKFLIPNHVREIRCFSKDDHGNKTTYKMGQMPDTMPMEYPMNTYCRLFCSKGYELSDSDRTIECQGNGKWNATLPECEGLHCDPLTAPENGDVHPPECITGNVNVRESCYFTCNIGYRLIGKPIFTCKRDLSWDFDSLPTCNLTKIKAFISCPEDVTVDLEPNNNSVNLSLPSPETNMETFVVQPEWVVVGQPTIFPAGKTDIRFSVIDSENKLNSCNMSVTVMDKEPPVFNYCPDSFNVEGSDVQVDWEEPIPFDNVGIDTFEKTLEPNSTLYAGIHIVEYIAKDFSANSAKCSFEINVTSVECRDLADPENGEANCLELLLGKICEPICNANFTRSLNDTEIFVCDDSGEWSPSNIISPCLPACPYGEIWSSESQMCEGNLTINLDSISSE